MVNWNLDQFITYVRRHSAGAERLHHTHTKALLRKLQGGQHTSRPRSYHAPVVLAYLSEFGIPEPKMEWKFCPGRNFRFDFAWPDYKVALEVEGGVFTRQAHGSVKGILKDMDKYNLAASLGWRVLRVIPANLCLRETCSLISQTLSVDR